MKKILLLFAVMNSAFELSAQSEGANQTLVATSPLEVVKTFLTAYKSRDHEKFTSLLHPDVVWVQPGDSRVSGVKKSKAELMLMGKQMAELSARTLLLADVQYFAPNGNSVVCLLHWTAAQPTGNMLDVRNIDVYTVENGKIVLARIYSDDIDAENTFWGK